MKNQRKDVKMMKSKAKGDEMLRMWRRRGCSTFIVKRNACVILIFFFSFNISTVRPYSQDWYILMFISGHYDLTVDIRSLLTLKL